MSIYIGNNKYKEIYLGSNKISEVYLGSSKIFAESGINLLPMSAWTIAPKSVSNNTINVTNNNTLNLYGVGNWNELIYRRYQPTESGNYTFSLKWNAPTGLDFWNSNSSDSYRKLGVWFDTSLSINTTNTYEGSRSQGILMYNHDNWGTAISMEQTGTVNLNSNTNYYIWISLGTLEDYKSQIITFTEMKLTKV